MSATPIPDDARFELKFAAAENAYNHLQSWLRLHSEVFVRSYPSRRVNNVYFDRFEYASYLEGNEGSSSRTKVRYRWYGDSALPDSGRFEAKVRQNRFGWKHWYPVDGISSSVASWADVKQYILSAIPAHARWWLVEYCCPVVINRYDREYWVSRNTGIRATLDLRQSIYDQRYAVAINTWARTEMPPTVVLELKAPARAEAAISQLVANLPVSISRNSKYCSAVDALRGF